MTDALAPHLAAEHVAAALDAARYGTATELQLDLALGYLPAIERALREAKEKAGE